MAGHCHNTHLDRAARLVLRVMPSAGADNGPIGIGPTLRAEFLWLRKCGAGSYTTQFP